VPRLLDGCPNHRWPVVTGGASRPLLAQTGGRRSGRVCPLCPGISDINLFRYCQSIVYLNPEISDCAFDLGVAKQKLDRSQIAGTPVD
jgi:hypothetical protein